MEAPLYAKEMALQGPSARWTRDPAQQEETPADMKHLWNMSVKMNLLERKHTWIDQGVDTEIIRNGKKLTDCHVGFAQQLVKRQFPHLNGLQPTVLQAKKTLGVRKVI